MIITIIYIIKAGLLSLLTYPPLNLLQPHIHLLYTPNANPIYNTLTTQQTLFYCCVHCTSGPSVKNQCMLLQRAHWLGDYHLHVCYLDIVRPCAIIPLSLRCRSSLSRVSRISLSTGVCGSSRGLRYDESSRPESSELGDSVEERGDSLGTGGWISL